MMDAPLAAKLTALPCSVVMWSASLLAAHGPGVPGAPGLSTRRVPPGAALVDHATSRYTPRSRRGLRAVATAADACAAARERDVGGDQQQDGREPRPEREAQTGEERHREGGQENHVLPAGGEQVAAERLSSGEAVPYPGPPGAAAQGAAGLGPSLLVRSGSTRDAGERFRFGVERRRRSLRSTPLCGELRRRRRPSMDGDRWSRREHRQYAKASSHGRGQRHPFQQALKHRPRATSEDVRAASA